MAPVEKIYRDLSIEGWNQAQASIQARVNQAKTYDACQVQLEPQAERRLQELLAPASTSAADQAY